LESHPSWKANEPAQSERKKAGEDGRTGKGTWSNKRGDEKRKDLWEGRETGRLQA